MKKQIGIQLPRQANPEAIEIRYALELEALEPVADIVEIAAQTPQEFADGVKDMDAIITSWGFRIDKSVIDKLEKCVVIGVGSVGVDMVDIEAATAAGIVVTNVPDVFIEEVADHAMMLLLSSARMSRVMHRMAVEDQWWSGRPLLSHKPRLMGQTLGLFAFGHVARCTARRAKSFGMNVIAYDPYVSELAMSAEGVMPVSFNELLERSDYISVHAPHNSETHHSFSTEAFARMPDHAVIVNTARGPIIDEAALIEALASGAIAGAGLDVLEQEPPSPDNPLFAMENVIISPHVASATTRMRPETRRRVGREVALVLRDRWPMSCVNPTVLPRVPLERWQPYSMERGPNR
ncbi:MAG TPA: 2-ketogluconate reductase [Gammaproteobacteria bacterium]|nr:2-ketogluconate reductase [Gammaproteobacteria bacterium]|tara:strand:- start:1530 stop:2579 length:1050 start_codon:yes stop_codon:yes gene_type:complete